MALIVLGDQHEPRVLEPALDLLPSVPPRPAAPWLRNALRMALSGLPADPGLAHARAWYHSETFVLRKSAEKILELHGEPADEVRTVFEEHAFSYARSRAAAAMASTDPAFPRDRAFECLWDCESETRAVGCARSDLAVPGARARLRVLAADPLEDEDVRRAARSRLA